MVEANDNKGFAYEDNKLEGACAISACCILFGGTLFFELKDDNGKKQLQFDGSFGGIGVGGFTALGYAWFSEDADWLVNYSKNEKISFQLVGGGFGAGTVEITWFEGSKWIGSAVCGGAAAGGLTVMGEGRFSK